MIKRQIYGRADFDMLRKRAILHSALPGSQNSRKSHLTCPKPIAHPFALSAGFLLGVGDAL